jgi:hypothetical protein
MDKRYQVFISSTFTDLQEERTHVQKMLMQLDCIPAGMELFPAIDEEQLEFIKRIIDDSDYYLLIIGGRYGSVGKDGVSYTEKEYDYAVSKNMKVIALLHSNPNLLSLEKSEKDPKARKSLERFRRKVLQGRIVLFWNDANELPGKLAQSLPVTIKTYPAVGWVRASSVPSSDIYKELNDLRRENDKLKSLINEQLSLKNTYNIAGLSDSLAIEVTYTTISSDFKNKQIRLINMNWGDLFYFLAPRIFKHVSEDKIGTYICNFFEENDDDGNPLEYVELNQSFVETVAIQFRALNLISRYAGEYTYFGATKKGLIWGLTPEGEKLLLINQAIKRSE